MAQWGHERGHVPDPRGRGSGAGGPGCARPPRLAGGLRAAVAGRSRRASCRAPTSRPSRSPAFFAAQADLEIEVKERAFKAYEAEGNGLRAAYLALDIARKYGYAGKPSIASAWTRRAERIIGPEGDTYAHGYLALVRSEAARATGDVEAALALAERAVAIGNGAADADLKAYALSQPRRAEDRLRRDRPTGSRSWRRRRSPRSTASCRRSRPGSPPAG